MKQKPSPQAIAARISRGATPSILLRSALIAVTTNRELQRSNKVLIAP